MKTQKEREEYRKQFVNIDFRQHPEKYRIGRGEEGVLLVEPYKSEILPHWKFKTPDIAKQSAQKIYELFLRYIEAGDFVGADMARKFLQMGYTRSRRYANHRSGKKYNGVVPQHLRGMSGAHGREILPPDVDEEKAESARHFDSYWQLAKQNPVYQEMIKAHKLIESQLKRTALS